MRHTFRFSSRSNAKLLESKTANNNFLLFVKWDRDRGIQVHINDTPGITEMTNGSMGRHCL
jgi:hypothetical protein